MEGILFRSGQRTWSFMQLEQATAQGKLTWRAGVTMRGQASSCIPCQHVHMIGLVGSANVISAFGRLGSCATKFFERFVSFAHE